MKKNKPTNLIKDYKKIIEIQERIIKATESERKQVHDLFMHYLDKSIEGWDWYARYWSEYKRLIKIIKLCLDLYTSEYRKEDILSLITEYLEEDKNKKRVA